MGDTKISWTHQPGTRGRTWNPVNGCSVISPGCANCYAMRMAGRFSAPGLRYHGLVEIAKNKRAIWTGKVRLERDMLSLPLKWREPSTVFVNSMADLFHDGLTNEEIAAVFGVMAAATRHTFIVLTKRARRMRAWFEWVQRDRGSSTDMVCQQAAWGMDVRVPTHHIKGTFKQYPWPLTNVWLGVSAENQDAADERIPDLLSTPAAVRLVSLEPLLGPIDLRHVQHEGTFEVDALSGRHGVTRPLAGRCARLDWVIAGCESGPGARPCASTWLRDLRDQCALAGCEYFLKQAAEYIAPAGPGLQSAPLSVTAGPGSTRKAGGVIEAPYLDGVQHIAFPARRVSQDGAARHEA